VTKTTSLGWQYIGYCLMIYQNCHEIFNIFSKCCNTVERRNNTVSRFSNNVSRLCNTVSRFCKYCLEIQQYCLEIIQCSLEICNDVSTFCNTDSRSWIRGRQIFQQESLQLIRRVITRWSEGRFETTMCFIEHVLLFYAHILNNWYSTVHVNHTDYWGHHFAFIGWAS
jgi:hypothetical protein